MSRPGQHGRIGCRRIRLPHPPHATYAPMAVHVIDAGPFLQFAKHDPSVGTVRFR